MESIITQITKIQHEIQSLLNKENGVSSHLINDSKSLNLVTYNPIHGETFLLHSIEHKYDSWLILTPDDKIDISSYEIMLHYVKKLVGVIPIKEYDTIPKNSYTLLWVKKDSVLTNQSYFYGETMIDVLTKFYYGKDKSQYNILEIKLNPSA
jgi:hypothetical protein